MFSRPRTLISIAFLAVPLGVQAEPTETIHCPAQIETQQAITNTPEGWEGIGNNVPALSKLVNVSLFDGNPEQQAELAPSSTQTTKQFLKNTWKLSGVHNGEVWLQCRYADTRLSLNQALKKTVTRCEATYNNRFNPPNLEGAKCW